MRFLINTFLKYRDPFALAVFFAGVPFIYFLRDGLKLAPNSMIFSIALIFLPFALTIPFKNFRFFDTPNKVTFPLMWWFLLFLFSYFYLKDRTLMTVSFIVEIQYYIIIILVGFSALFMRKEAVSEKLIILALIFSLVSAVALIYYVTKNPLYVLGQRASFTSEGESGAGNPHINSKGAFFGIIAAVMALKYYKTVKLGLILPVIVIVLSLVVLFLTQTVLAFLCTFVFVCLFLTFNLSFNNLVSTFRLFFSKWYVVLLIITGVSTFIYKINQNREFLDPVFNYATKRIENIQKSVFEKEKKTVITETGDDSANTRVLHVTGSFERLVDAFNDGDYHYVLFGQGYKYMYLDVPHLEMLDSFGIVGFILFSILFFRMVVMALREMRNPESAGTEFLAYVFIYLFFANFIAGQMLDYTRFSSLFIICRFLKK